MPETPTRKEVKILGRRFTVSGDLDDRYFREYVPDRGTFHDVPIAMAWEFVAQDAVCVDVGANIGLASLAFARVAPKGRVIAFEPSPRSFAHLQRNVLENGLGNVECVNAALSNKPGLLDLQEDRQFMAGSRIRSGEPGNDAPVVQVPASTLDDELSRRGIERLDLLKIDVEGFEAEVLEGARESLRRFQPLCLIEFNFYSLVYHRRMAPRAFLSLLEAQFPRIFHFDTGSFTLDEITGRGDEFLARAERAGFVHDLVCAFGDLPPRLRSQRHWIIRWIRRKVRRLIGPPRRG